MSALQFIRHEPGRYGCVASNARYQLAKVGNVWTASKSVQVEGRGYVLVISHGGLRTKAEAAAQCQEWRDAQDALPNPTGGSL